MLPSTNGSQTPQDEKLLLEGLQQNIAIQHAIRRDPDAMDAYQLCLCRFMLGENALLHSDKYRRDDGRQRQHYLCASFNQLFWLELRHIKHMKWHPHGKALMVPLDADGSLHEESRFRQESDILPDESSDSRDDARQ